MAVQRNKIPNFRNSWRTVVLDFIRLWLVYGLVESFCLSILVRLRKGGTLGHGQDWVVTGFLTLIVYPLVALISGSLLTLAMNFLAGRTREFRMKTLLRLALPLCEAFIGGLFLINALFRQQPYAVPGAMLVVLMAVLHLKKDWAWRSLNRLAAALPAEGAVVLMGMWALVFQPRESVSSKLIAASAVLVLLTVLVAFWIGKLVWEKWARGRAKDVVSSARLSIGISLTLSVLLLTAQIGISQHTRRESHRNALSTIQKLANSSLTPNVVLISLDTVRADRMSVYGYPRDTTPFLKRFIQEGATLYTNSYSSSNYTLSSHASIFTGLQASASGAFRNSVNTVGRPIHEQVPVLTEIVKKMGYATFAAVANPGYLSPVFGFARGFDRYRIKFPFGTFVPTRRVQFFQQTIKELAARCGMEGVFRVTADASSIIRDFRSYIREKHSRPFFIFLNFMDAHWPFLPPRHVRDDFQDVAFRVYWDEAPEYQNKLLANTLDPSFLPYISNQYDASIRHLDGSLEEMITLLQKEGEFENTMIIITSDHGEGLGANRIIKHGVGVGDDQVRVPLIIKYPGQNRPEKDNRPASNTDILPTVCDTVGKPWTFECHGFSLRIPPSSRKDPLVVESFAAGMGDDEIIRYTPGLAEALFVFPDHRVRWHFKEGILFLSRPEYDGGQEEVVQRMASLQQINAYLEKVRTWIETGKTIKLSPAELERLRSLGYVR